MSKAFIDIDFRTIGRSPVALDKPPEGMPDKVLDQPCTYVWTPALPRKTIKHPRLGWKVEADKPGYLEGVVAQTKEYLKNGNEPFLPERHMKKYDAKSSFGFVKDVKLDGDCVWLLEQLIGDDAKKYRARNKTSIELTFDKVDGQGKQYKNVITHNAFCPDPVVPGQVGFAAMSDSADGPGDVVPVFQMDESAQGKPAMNEEQLKALRELLGDEEVTAENWLEKVKAAFTALKEAKKPADSAQASVSLSDSAEMTPMEKRMLKDGVAQRVGKLPTVGIAKPVVDKLLKVLGYGDKPTVLSMSETAEGDPLALAVLDILCENKPPKVGSPFGSQTVAMSQSGTLSETGEDAEDKEEAEAIKRNMSGILPNASRN